MEKELCSDEVIVDISDAGKRLNSRDPNGEIEIEKQESGNNIQESGSNIKSPKVTPPVTPKTPLMASPGSGEDEEIYVKVNPRRKKIKLLFVMEFSLFLCITVVLIASKFTNLHEKREIWSLEIWKWCVLLLAIFCGRMFSEWLIKGVISSIGTQLLLRKNVLYFVYGARRSTRVFIWLGLILLTWVLLINRGVHRSQDTKKVLNYITRGIASTLVIAGAWILRTLFVKAIASSFHVNRFFDRIEENIFHQYILQALSGPPLMEISKSINRSRLSSKQLTFSKGAREQTKKNVIDIQKHQKMKRGKASAWTIDALIRVVRNSGFSYALDESEDDVGQDEERYIISELEAITAAKTIFKNVAKPGHKYIEEDDLFCFMVKDEVERLLASIGGAVGSKGIKKKPFTNWVVNVYKERKSLTVSLNSTKTAIAQLNKFFTGLTVIVLIILWLILMGIATTEVLLFISSQFLLALFSFGTSAKSTLEAIIFVFVKHPFDVGDRCVIDGVQVVVEDVSMLTTVFLRYDNEKIYYPNAVLATKSISNLNRSPNMSDYVDFDLDVSTSVDNIKALKAKIKKYIKSKPHLWHAKHNVRIREIEDVNKIKMSLHVTHTINFQDYEEKNDRRSKLVLELKKIFEELEIKYHILPQEVITRTY